MVGSLLSTSSASVYTASTRYLVAGGLVNTAILQVIAPKLAELLSAGLVTARTTSTSWRPPA
jgi:O-antigen/teichoic acid export membrane protein